MLGTGSAACAVRVSAPAVHSARCQVSLNVCAVLLNELYTVLHGFLFMLYTVSTRFTRFLHGLKIVKTVDFQGFTRFTHFFGCFLYSYIQIKKNVCVIRRIVYMHIFFYFLTRVIS